MCYNIEVNDYSLEICRILFERISLITCITFDDISPAFLSTVKFQSLLDILSRLRVPCTFFVVPGKGFSSSSDFEFKSSLRSTLSLGHELSLHGYEHILNEFGYLSWRSYGISLSVIPLPSFDKQSRNLQQAIDVFRRLTGVRPFGFRAPYYRCNDQTLNALSSLGFRYDSTKTLFRPAHGARVRFRWSRHCRPHRSHGLVEIAVTGDYTYNLNNVNFSNSLKRAIRDFEWVMSDEGVFVMNIHPHQSDANLLYKFLKEFVKEVYNRTCFYRLIDVALMNSPSKFPIQSSIRN